MKITIIGTGYVGLVTGACLAEQGNDVLCLDVDTKKIELLNAGGMPIYEPGLKDLIDRNRASNRLAFTSDIEKSVAFGDIQLIAVGTPPDEDGSADLRFVLDAARNIGKWMTGFKVVVDKSTVPVGTADKVAATISEELAARGFESGSDGEYKPGVPHFSVVSNPEFLKEGAAVDDFMRPDRVVIGIKPGKAGEKALAAIRLLYAPFNRNHDKIVLMDVRSAELTKYAANAMLATRISFMNELANLADSVGADIEMVRQGIGSDTRIGYSFLYAGTGYGGSCFPKDVQALNGTAQKNGLRLRLLEAVEEVNNLQKRILCEKVVARFGEDLRGHHFAIWGLAFKPNTDDMRAAPSRVIVRELLERGASVCVFDPVAADEAKRCFALDFSSQPDLLSRISYGTTPMQALAAADALIIVTEWKVFRSPNFQDIKAALKNPLIFDGRNLYQPEAMRDLGFDYRAIGRTGTSSSTG
jgi:UDPglucose 6-dehydrogenase